MITKTLIDADTHALTLLNPWAHAIVAPGADPKRVENRCWPAPRSLDTFLIHAGKGWDEFAPDALTAAARGTTTSAIVAVARLSYCCDTTVRDQFGLCGCGRWSVRGEYHWKLGDVHVLGTPVPERGAQKLWRPKPEVLAAVREQLP